jgi:hypothetical protein
VPPDGDQIAVSRSASAAQFHVPPPEIIVINALTGTRTV